MLFEKRRIFHPALIVIGFSLVLKRDARKRAKKAVKKKSGAWQETLKPVRGACSVSQAIPIEHHSLSDTLAG